ncbi:hypothetical protein PILCRDRAFT_2082 [Piloderma croceum F 1598]|uniref:Uncharacterized protein n=1 Tax=Piloderma croceum (strain F 1598) TaxID=765440 RepID=A0A0C3GGP0_PILCF|nr:hypothetical protein PILCRDRAFT_2082 [Piloderma croceum F 1598]
MTGLKRSRNDENWPISNTNSPLPEFRDRLKRRRKALNISMEEIQVLRDRRAANDARIAEEQEERLLAEAEAAKEAHRAKGNARLQHVLASVMDAGFTLYEFLDELMHTRDRGISSQVSQMLILRGSDLLESIRQRQLKMAHAWAAKTTAEMLARESLKLAERLRPQQNREVTHVLEEFSLTRIMHDAEELAPTLCELLRAVGVPEASPACERKNRDLVLVTVICMLTRCRNEHSSEFQTTTCIYLLACGASRSQFDVLNHAGFMLSYTAAIAKIKTLRAERLR